MSKQLNSHLITQDGESNLTVYYGGDTYVAHETHPAWEKLVAGVLADDPKVVELFDIGRAIGQQLSLSDRVTYAKGHLFLDGDEITDGLANHIVRMFQAGDEVVPFVNLLEKILQNPSDNSRTQLYRYIDRHHITITPDGDLVLYKYVNKALDKSDKPYRASHIGSGVVNGLASPNNEYIHQGPGDVVTLARSKVADDPSAACSTGLHVGAWGYVGNSGEVRLEVRVHPRDVVSVPHDASEMKIRVCRYTIVGEITKPYDEPVLRIAPKPAPTPTAVEAPPGAYTSKVTRHPSKSAFRKMRLTAKARKKGFTKVAESAGWKLIGGHGDKREDWSIR